MKNRERFIKQVEGAVLGSVVGDALGVPAEFMSRREMQKHPVTAMRSGGAHQQPAGTGSDDTSMVLCTMDSLMEHGVDYEDQMQREAAAGSRSKGRFGRSCLLPQNRFFQMGLPGVYVPAIDPQMAGAGGEKQRLCAAHPASGSLVSADYQKL